MSYLSSSIVCNSEPRMQAKMSSSEVKLTNVGIPPMPWSSYLTIQHVGIESQPFCTPFSVQHRISDRLHSGLWGVCGLRDVADALVVIPVLLLSRCSSKSVVWDGTVDNEKCQWERLQNRMCTATPIWFKSSVYITCACMCSIRHPHELIERTAHRLDSQILMVSVAGGVPGDLLIFVLLCFLNLTECLPGAFEWDSRTESPSLTDEVESRCSQIVQVFFFPSSSSCLLCISSHLGRSR